MFKLPYCCWSIESVLDNKSLTCKKIEKNLLIFLFLELTVIISFGKIISGIKIAYKRMNTKINL